MIRGNLQTYDESKKTLPQPSRSDVYILTGSAIGIWTETLLDLPERKKITNERAVGIAGAKERRERNEETRIEAQRDESWKERARYLRTRDHEYRVAVGSLSGALLLGVESGSRPPTLDFERYPFSFYYLLSLHPRVDVPHRARSLSLETHLVRETFVPSIFHAERNATPPFNYSSSRTFDDAAVFRISIGSLRFSVESRREGEENREISLVVERRESLEQKRETEEEVDRPYDLRGRSRNPYRRIAGQRVAPVLE